METYRERGAKGYDEFKWKNDDFYFFLVYVWCV
jgi:hypothetical protein